MNQIQEVPNRVTQAGLGFNYEVWTAGTEITLANVPWNNDYRDIVEFADQTQLDRYVMSNSGPTINFTGTSYARPGAPVRVNIPFNAAYKFNYLRVRNPAQPITGDGARVFYYFITGVNHINPNTTELSVQLDVWQTFFSEVEFGRSFVERGHIGIANSAADEQNGRKFLTVPEGFDLGGEYLIRQTTTRHVGKNSSAAQGYGVSVIVVSTVSFPTSGGTIDNPKLNSAIGQTAINGVPSGADVYFFETPAHFSAFLLKRSEQPWVTQGIISAYLIPGIPVSDISSPQVYDPGSGEYRKMTSYPPSFNLKMTANWRAIMKTTIPPRYRRLTKLLTYPYCFVELTMFNGKPLVVKPESLNPEDDDLETVIHQMVTPPNPRVMIVPKDYNRRIESGAFAQDEYLDFATGLTDLPQIAIVNNMYLSYMASNKNNIAFQHRSADWAQQRALGSAQTSYDQATGGIGAAQDSMGVSNAGRTAQMQQANETARYQAATNIIGSAAGGLASAGTGNAGGAVGAIGNIAGAAMSYGIQSNQNIQSTAISNNTARNLTNISTSQSGFVRDTNKDLADWAAKGDYSNTIAGINAKVQDAQMIQPSVSGQIAGEAFTFSVMEGFKLRANWKMVDDNTMTMVGEFWLRYGYAVNRFHVVDRLSLMTSFTYWKTKEMYIKAARLPETFKQSIRGIFEKGVTVWRRPEDIATADLSDNHPAGTVTLK